MSDKKMNKNLHTCLVALSPIEYRPDDPDGRLATASKALEEESRKEHEDQLLRQCPMVHMARVQIIGDVIPQMGQHPPDSLKSKYLLLVAEIDGDIDDFFDALYNGPQYPFDWAAQSQDQKKHADFVHNVWGQCIGYPEERGCVFFRQYMQRCRIKVTLPFAAYNHTVAQINEAKEKQAAFAAFAEDTQSLGPAELFNEWQTFVKQHEHSAATGTLVIDKSGRAEEGHTRAGEAATNDPVLHKGAADQPQADGRRT